jgi:ATP-dependent DNA helicase RecQ
LLSTLHGAKGLEFPHVLIADGPGGRSAPEEQRRLYYVGMTRARETLALGRLPGGGNPPPTIFDGDWLLHTSPEIPAPPPEVLARRYDLLTPADIDLGFAGRRSPRDPIHARIAALPTGAALQPRSDGEAVLLCDRDGGPVARLSRRAAAQWLPRIDAVKTASAVAWLRRRCEDGDLEHRNTCRSDVWEYPLTELVWYSDSAVCAGSAP